MALKCAGCLQKIPNREYLACCLCKDKYDLLCANVSIQRFLNTMTVEHKAVWKCDKCRSKAPKIDNTNTPIREQQNTLITSPNTNASFLSENITIRARKTKCNETISTINDLSVLDETLNTESKITDSNKRNTLQEPTSQVITLQQFESLLDKKLDSYKQSLLNELIETITCLTSREITTFKKELTQTTDNLVCEQTNISDKIQQMNTSINELNRENCKLWNEIQEIQTSLNKLNSQQHLSKNINESILNINKKIVIYGMEERRENESELQDRVIYLFQDVLNLNVSGCLEDIKRLGKKGHRRPILVELLSKNMTNYILKNRRAFKNTGIAVTELLEGESLKYRKKLIETLIAARKEGHRANIINNKLIINGNEFKPSIEKEAFSSVHTIQHPEDGKNIDNTQQNNIYTTPSLQQNKNNKENYNYCTNLSKTQSTQEQFFRR